MFSKLKSLFENLRITSPSVSENAKQVSDLIRWYIRVDQQCEKAHKWIVRPEYKARAISRCKIRRYSELIEKLEIQNQSETKKVDNRRKINALKRKRSNEYRNFIKYDVIIKKQSRESKIQKR